MMVKTKNLILDFTGKSRKNIGLTLFTPFYYFHPHSTTPYGDFIFFALPAD